MSYPSQNDPSGRDYSAQSGYPGASAYGQGEYGQGGYGQGAYGAQPPAYSAQGNPGAAPAARPGPPSNVGWAVASILFFWPLSFIAMTRALDVYPLWAAGRHAEAEAASATAKKLGVISLAIVVGFIALYVLFMIVAVGLAASGY